MMQKIAKIWLSKSIFYVKETVRNFFQKMKYSGFIGYIPPSKVDLIWNKCKIDVAPTVINFEKIWSKKIKNKKKWPQYLHWCEKVKVIDTKYSKHWPYTVAHTIECVCSKINNSWFNPWFSFYFSSLYSAPYLEWYMC